MNDSASSIDTVPADQAILSVIEECSLNISQEKQHNLVEYLMDMGAVELQDIVYLTDDDLKPYLATLQRRKFLHFIKKKVENQSQISSCFYNGSQEEDDAEPVSKSDCLWIYEFQENILPESTLDFLKKKVRLPPAERRLLIRLIAKDILSKHQAPGRRILRQVAYKVVLKYPKSLADFGLNGHYLGDGCGSFFLQLENSISNTKRQGTKRPADSSSSDCNFDHNNAHVNVQPEFASRQVSADELESIRLALLAKFQALGDTTSQALDEEEKVLINKCFSGIQSIIKTQSKRVSEIGSDWPILFTKPGFFQHYQQVVGRTLETFHDNMTKSLVQFLTYMQSLQLKRKEFKAVIKSINDAKQVTKDDQPQILGMINLLCEYFHEDFNQLVLKEGITIDDVPITPCIIAKGPSVYTAKRFDVMVDRMVVFEDTSAADALAFLLGSFYLFNIEYPAGNALTLEFLQWSLAEIHPQRGNKTEKKGKNKSRVNGIHAKVIGLMNNINDFCLL